MGVMQTWMPPTSTVQPYQCHGLHADIALLQYYNAHLVCHHNRDAAQGHMFWMPRIPTSPVRAASGWSKDAKSGLSHTL